MTENIIFGVNFACKIKNTNATRTPDCLFGRKYMDLGGVA